jgi:hypothetical protein
MVRVRFPNETYYDVIPNFNWNEFKPGKINSEFVFGWYQDVYISVDREDYDEYVTKKNN